MDKKKFNGYFSFKNGSYTLTRGGGKILRNLCEMKSGLMEDMGFDYKGVKPVITEKEMNVIINVRKIASIESSPETISMLSSSMEVITTPSSSRFLFFKKLAGF